MDSDFTYERFCRAVVDGCSEAVLFADRQGIIRLWNAGAEAMFGYSAPEALGSSLDLIIPENLRGRHWAGYHRVVESGATRYAQELLAAPALTKDGRRISVEFSMVLVRGAAGGILGVAAVIRDVSVRWEKERALRLRLASLERELQRGDDIAGQSG